MYLCLIRFVKGETLRPPRKVLAAILAIAAIGGATLKAQKSLIDFAIESYVISKIVDAAAGGIAWIAEKSYDKYKEYFGNEARADDAKPTYKKVKIPILKRHTNFIVIKNMSRGKWTFQVANLSKAEIAQKGEKNLPESGTVTIFKGRPDVTSMPLEVVAICDPGGEKVTLESGLDYLFYPNLSGKIGGIKAFADNFNRTVYLEDATGKKYACNMMRNKDSKARVTFGVITHSWPAVQANKGLELDLKNPDYDDMFFIMKDTIATY
jgi:hypothetical protein